MPTMTLDQLRVANEAGGVADVTLKGAGGNFFVEIATRNGTAAVLAKARSTEPRAFANLIAALNVLRGVGITVGHFDASEWNPDTPKASPGNRGRADAMRKAHKAAAYSGWLATEIQNAIDDPRPNVAHDDVMAQMDADIALLTAPKKRSVKRRA